MDDTIKRVDAWLATCQCDKGYCTFCDILWDVKDAIDNIPQAICATLAFGGTLAVEEVNEQH